MKWRLVVYGLIGIAIIFATETPSTQRNGIEIVFKAQDKQINPYQEEYEKLLYPTVRISSPAGTGSGVVISHRDTEVTETDIYVLTAAHVVENESKVQVEFFYQAITKIEATVIITDTAKDLALIRVICGIHDIRVKDIYSATLAPKDYTPYLFTPVWTVGCSLGLKPRPSFGHLCALCDSVADNWEVSSPVLPGNSGGPVYDARTYEVIGIAVWVHTYQGQLITTMAGVVPINEIYEFLTSHQDTKTLRK
ncbi:MAG: serine protease [Planctomycetota bacterium]